MEIGKENEDDYVLRLSIKIFYKFLMEGKNIRYLLKVLENETMESSKYFFIKKKEI